MSFTGLAQYDRYDGVYEDVSDTITMLSPSVVPLLDLLGIPAAAATQTYHEWLEDKYMPHSVINSTAITSDASTTYSFSIRGSEAGFLQWGDVLMSSVTNEYMIIVSTSTNTLTVKRASQGTTASSLGAGNTLYVVGMAALEGSDIEQATQRNPSRTGNYVQIFKRDFSVSETMRAVNAIGYADAFEYEKLKKTKEAMIDLESAMILGKYSTAVGTIGSSTVPRVMNGLISLISTNIYTVGSGATLTTSLLDSAINACWSAGADDIDVLVCDAAYKRIIDGWQETHIRVVNSETKYEKQVWEYASTFMSNPIRIVLNRWMPASNLFLIASNRVKPVPLRNRSFHFQEKAKTGDYKAGSIIGEYTAEVRGASTMARIYG
ncbi:DUF5309 domain-containing protein [Candidatus Pacearchaeota archaeon]|jgi:hypothetical protein|nr:DUF5309 domain-containing protein [Candidatus Pacearchaeota archaeon]